MWCSVVMVTLRALQFFLFLLVWPYVKVVSMSIKKRRVPPITNPLLMKTAADLAHLIRTQKVSSTQVLNAFIDRIKIIEPIINSVVEDRFEAALQEAKQVDALLNEKGDAQYWASTKPLLGVPVSIKETIPVAGLSNNGGRSVPKERRAEADCAAVRALRAAGAIPFLVSNTPELCLFWETYNRAKGRTNNPYNTQRTAGGSSGGECALISSGGSVIGLGSDIAGSGRLPAMFCGICGHKPTPRMISVEEHLPESEDPEWNKFLVLAPLARYASDLPLLLKATAPPEALARLQLDKEVDFKKLKIFYMEDCESTITNAVSQEIKDAVTKCAMHFKTFGNEPKKVLIENFGRALESAVQLMLSMKSPRNIFQKSDDSEDWSMLDVLREICKKHMFCSKYMAYSIYFGLLTKIVQMTPSRLEAMKKLKSEMSKELEEMLGEEGVLLLPVFPDTAHKHYGMYYKMLDSAYLTFSNLLELPATVCPVGLSSASGLPIAVQIIANKYQDRLSLAVAQELERRFGGWVPPSGDCPEASLSV